MSKKKKEKKNNIHSSFLSHPVVHLTLISDLYFLKHLKRATLGSGFQIFFCSDYSLIIKNFTIPLAMSKKNLNLFLT